MKKYCKNFNILDIDFLNFCVKECLKKKWGRRDVIEYFHALTDISEKNLRKNIKDPEQKKRLIHVAALHMQKQLINRDLSFVPIWYKEKTDPSSQKIRRIGIQHVSQQLYDYVAVYSMSDLMKRIGEYQCASIRGRGPIFGMEHIKKWLKEKDVKYVAQLDVHKCFQSIAHDKLLAFIDRYVANDDIKWLVRQLVNTFEDGLSIGSFLSQYLCNLYLSQLYHEISENIYYERRGKRINCVKHVLFYMDDIFICGSNAKKLNVAVEHIIDFSKTQLGIEMKPSWRVWKIKDKKSKKETSTEIRNNIKDSSKNNNRSKNQKPFLDMMGFRIYFDHVTVRKRVFLRMRRAFKKCLKEKGKKITLQQAHKCISYFGDVKNTNLLRFAKRYKVYRTIKKAKGVISRESKLRCKATKSKNCKRR